MIFNMSSYLKYLERYEEKGNDVIFHLKDYHSSRLAGNKITRELYIFLFHDETLQLNRIQKVNDLTYLVQKEQKYFCLNCEFPIFFDDDNSITMCDNCNWRNELNDTPCIAPIIIKTKTFEDYSCQICYPLIEEKNLKGIPEKLREAIEIYFKKPRDFNKSHYQNIYHSLYAKKPEKFREIAKKYKNKAILSDFFQKTNLFK